MFLNLSIFRIVNSLVVFLIFLAKKEFIFFDFHRFYCYD